MGCSELSLGILGRKHLCWNFSLPARRIRSGFWGLSAVQIGPPSCRHQAATGHSVRVVEGRLNGNGREFEDFLVLQVGVGSAVSASLARQIENAVDWPDRVEGAGVAALERHLARPVVVDPALVA